jgi:ABC-type polysaccharide/polyol phosphate transport system ATPase subunit
LSGQKQDSQIIRAISDLSLKLSPGDRIGVIGPNGAGKTTLLRVLAGILHPTSGSIEINGSVISLIDQSLGFNFESTGYENIIRRGIFLNQTRESMVSKFDEIAKFSGLGDRLKHPMSTYSQGMKSRLSFSIATALEPSILVIDEGIGAADEEFAQKAAERLNEFLNKPLILILASHSKELIASFTDRTISLENGQIIN